MFAKVLCSLRNPFKLGNNPKGIIEAFVAAFLCSIWSSFSGGGGGGGGLFVVAVNERLQF